MDYLETEFENQGTKDTISYLADIVSNYDIYDFISRVAGLNLLSQNQNKSVLMDSLLQYLLIKPRIRYSSISKMSDHKFKSIMDEISNTYLAASIDPCENTFVQNVMFNGENYRVFNGIDVTPAYNLQSLIKVLFGYTNNINYEYLKKVNRLFALILGVSENIARQLGISVENSLYNEEQKIIVPAGEIVRRNAELINLPLDRINGFIDGFFSIEELLIDFGYEDVGDINNRPFYTAPFIYNHDNGNVIILNISLLPAFAFYKAIEWAEQYNIKEEVLARYNDYLWIEVKTTLDKMGHHKIDEKMYEIECVSNEYFKESILTVYNNQLLFLFFICDDGESYTRNVIHNNYPDSRHTTILQERFNYHRRSLCNLGADKNDAYCIIIINSIGRAIRIGINDNPFGFKPISINPFEIHCVAINERGNNHFFPRYIRAKDQTNPMMSGLFSELNSICIYTSNHNSFYMSDDIDTNNVSVYIAPGDSIDYITAALQKENRKLMESYDDGSKTEVILADKNRNIYVEDLLFPPKHFAFFVLYSNIKIWIVTENITDIEQINLLYSFADAISYWLSECKDIIESYEFPYDIYILHILLNGKLVEYYYERNKTTPFEKCIDQQIQKNHIYLTMDPRSLGNFNCKYNDQEKELCRYILDIFDNISLENRDYSCFLDGVFRNPLKKKFYFADYEEKPYLKPLKVENHRTVHGEDEDYLSGIVGRELLKTGKWSVGIVDNNRRCEIARTVVDWLYNKLKVMVAEFEPDHIVEAIYLDLEETIYRIMMAERRYYSDVACYPEKEKEYLEEYNKLNKTSLALKFLIEYVTARPSTGKKPFGIGQYEELIAICSMIIDWAYKGDLFYYSIVNTPVEFLKSKRIGMHHDEFVDMFQYNEAFRRKQLSYDSSYPLRKDYPRNTQDFSEELERAFKAEFGYTYSDFVQVIATMISINNDEIICISKSEIMSKLITINNNLSEEVIQKVLFDIVYQARQDFLKLPKGYDKDDAYPWRFNRKYSFNRRPVLEKGDTLVWGNRQLYHMLEYMVDLIYTEKIKADSVEMKSLCGKIAKHRGAAFNDLIVEIIQDMNAFSLYPNVKKINGKRIAVNGGDLGDIDILIIDKEDKKIFAAEVKCFRFSRNPREIHQEYQKMFVDTNRPCIATKHNKRVQWLKDHMSDVIQEFNLEDDSWAVSGLFIVDQQLISQSIFKQNIKCISKADLCIESLKDI